MFGLRERTSCWRNGFSQFPLQPPLLPHNSSTSQLIKIACRRWAETELDCMLAPEVPYAQSWNRSGTDLQHERRSSGATARRSGRRDVGKHPRRLSAAQAGCSLPENCSPKHRVGNFLHVSWRRCDCASIRRTCGRFLVISIFLPYLPHPRVTRAHSCSARLALALRRQFAIIRHGARSARPATRPVLASRTLPSRTAPATAAPRRGRLFGRQPVERPLACLQLQALRLVHALRRAHALVELPRGPEERLIGFVDARRRGGVRQARQRAEDLVEGVVDEERDPVGGCRGGCVARARRRAAVGRADLEGLRRERGTADQCRWRTVVAAISAAVRPCWEPRYLCTSGAGERSRKHGRQW